MLEESDLVRRRTRMEVAPAPVTARATAPVRVGFVRRGRRAINEGTLAPQGALEAYAAADALRDMLVPAVRAAIKECRHRRTWPDPRQHSAYGKIGIAGGAICCRPNWSIVGYR